MTEERLDLINRAEKIVSEAFNQEGYIAPELLKDALAQAIRVHGLTQAGAFALVSAFANVERQAGRLPPKPFPFDDFKEE